MAGKHARGATPTRRTDAPLSPSDLRDAETPLEVVAATAAEPVRTGPGKRRAAPSPKSSRVGSTTNRGGARRAESTSRRASSASGGARRADRSAARPNAGPGGRRAHPQAARSKRLVLPLAVLATTTLVVAPAAYAINLATEQQRNVTDTAQTVAAARIQRPIMAREVTVKPDAASQFKDETGLDLPDVGTIPGRAVAAYKHAAALIDKRNPSCHLPWELLGGIGAIESANGTLGGVHLLSDGTTSAPIIGPALTGSNGFAKITDSDNGKYDGDKVHDHAVGPMQFIPSTWRMSGTDGDGNGTLDPNDIDDAAATAAVYLCKSGANLSVQAGQQIAVFSYNHSAEYVNTVLGMVRAYTAGQYDAVPQLFDYPMALPSPSASPTESPSSKPGKHKATKRPKPVHRPKPKPKPSPTSSPSPTATPSS